MLPVHPLPSPSPSSFTSVQEHLSLDLPEGRVPQQDSARETRIGFGDRAGLGKGQAGPWGPLGFRIYSWPGCWLKVSRGSGSGAALGHYWLRFLSSWGASYIGPTLEPIQDNLILPLDPQYSPQIKHLLAVPILPGSDTPLSLQGCWGRPQTPVTSSLGIQSGYRLTGGYYSDPLLPKSWGSQPGMDSYVNLSATNYVDLIGGIWGQGLAT